MTNRVTFELILRQLRRCHFAVLSTVDKDGMPNSAGVNYGVSTPGSELAIYVMTRRHLQKARDIAQNPHVSLVVPVPRSFLWFMPPATIQLHGRASILDGKDSGGTDVFNHFWMGRQILNAYEKSRRRGETRICFLKITPDPLIRTYMVGYNIWEIRKRMESGAAKVVMPEEQLHGNSRREISAEGNCRRTANSLSRCSTVIDQHDRDSIRTFVAMYLECANRLV